MTIVVVGATGRVGRLLVPHWRRSAAPVLLQFRKAPPVSEKDRNLRWNPDEGTRALESWVAANAAPSCMIVLAGITPRSGDDLSLNTRIAKICLDAAKRVGIPRALVASSSAVYGDYLDRPFRETNTCRPVNDYGRAKLAMEEYCRSLVEPGLQVTCLRLGNIAGADALLSRVDATDGKEIAIDRFKDGGTPLRSYIGAETLADTLLQLASFDGALPPVLNIAAPEPVEMAALANAAHLPWHPRPKPEWSGQRITLDCKRLWNLISPPPKASDSAEMIRQLEISRNAQ